MPSCFIDNEQVKGYKISTRLNSYYKKNKNELNENDRLILENYKKINISLNLSSTGLGQSYMVYPVYESLESPPASVSYYVHYVKKK